MTSMTKNLRIVLLSIIVTANFQATETIKKFKKNENHPKTVSFLRLRAYEKNYSDLCPADETKAQLKEKILDSLNQTHKFLNTCLLAQDKTGFILKDEMNGSAKILARCPAVPMDKSYWGLIQGFKKCQIGNMKLSWNTYANDIRVLANGDWEKLKKFHMDYWCVNARLINMNCPKQIRPSMFHSSIIHTINAVTELELEEAEIPYTGLSIILDENRKANSFLTNTKLILCATFILVLIIWLAPIKKWTSQQSGKVATIFGAYTKILEILSIPIFIAVIKLLRSQCVRSLKGWYEYLIDIPSWTNNVSPENKYNLQIRSQSTDSYARLSTSLTKKERELAKSEKVQKRVNINSIMLESLGINNNVDETSTFPSWMTSRKHKLAEWITSILCMILVQFLAFYITTTILGLTLNESQGILTETIKQRWQEFGINGDTDFDDELD